MGRGLGDLEVAYAESRGVKFKDDPVDHGPAVDHSGPDISVHYGLYKLADGEQKTVTFNRAGTVSVVPSHGTQIFSLTDHVGTRELAGNHRYDRFMPAGSYTFSIRSAGGNVMVELR